MIELKLNRKDMGNLLKEHFPKYKGRRITLHMQATFSFNTVDLYWSGGFKKSIVIIDVHGNKQELNCYRGELAGTNPLLADHQSYSNIIQDDHLIMVHQYAGREQWIDVYVSKTSDWVIHNGDQKIFVTFKKPQSKQLYDPAEDQQKQMEDAFEKGLLFGLKGNPDAP